MPDEYYPPESAEDGGGEPATAPEETAEDEATTALIPKSLLAGKEFKPGDEITMKVVHIFEDEVEVEYASEPPREGGEEDNMASANDELRGMAALKE